ncbi:MAG: hypothetical protein JSU96_02330, partial [Acidobacteriota bacterium]
MRTVIVNVPVIWCLLVAGYAEVEQVASIDLYYSGDVQGNFEPCGCKAGPTGGPARRAGVTLDSRDAVHRAGLHIDAGNYFAGPGPGAAAVNDFMQYSLEFIPVEVMNLGADDLYWWPELSKLELARTQFISTNLRPREPGVKAPPRYAVVEISAGQLGVKRPVRIGFLGIVDPGLVKPNSKL